MRAEPSLSVHVLMCVIQEPRINLEEAKKMCRPAASHLACAQLVYGAAGKNLSCMLFINWSSGWCLILSISL